jgi:hypothetical protein
MKSLTIDLSDDVYERAQKRAAEQGASLPQEVAVLVERYGAANGASLEAARSRMTQLFASVKGFRMTPKIAREELHERGSLR